MIRSTRRFGLAICLAISILSPAKLLFADDATLKLAPNPEWCRTGYRCITIDDYAAMTAVKIRLEEALKKETSGSRHFGFGCTVGPSVGFVVDTDFHSRIVPSDLAATCGLTVKL